MENAARTVLLLELRILRIVGVLRLLFRIQVVEIPEKLVETMRGRQKLVAVAEVVLAELPAGVAERLQDVGNRWVFGSKSEIGTRKPDFREAGADRRLTCDERRATGRTALLAVPIGEVRTLLGDAVDVRGAIPHHAVVVHADVEPADVVAHDDQNVGLVALSHLRLLRLLTDRRRGGGKHSACHDALLCFETAAAHAVKTQPAVAATTAGRDARNENVL